MLSYDCTFYALLILSLTDEPPSCYTARCRVNPLKKCSYARTSTEALSLAAALSVSSVYYKLIDNIADSGFFSRLLYRLLKPVVGRWNRRAAEKYPDIEQAVHRMSDDQRTVESDPGCSVDRAAEPTAMMLSTVCAAVERHVAIRHSNENTRRILSTFGYFLGRWIYLMDAADDYDKDQSSGGFNPFVLSHIERDAIPEAVLPPLNHALSETLLSYGLLEKGRYDSIIMNILCAACPKAQTAVLSKYQTGEEDEKSL